MTATKEMKDLRTEMKVMRVQMRQLKEAKHLLGISERASHRTEIKRLTEKAKDKDTYYTIMMKFKEAFLNEKRERKKLERKMKHLHIFYKGLLNDTKTDI